jgi:uncharacterized protein (TIGR02145 family)
MKQVFLFIISASLVFTSCKKDDPKKEEANTVEIGGTAYPTVVIGTQTWTASNYNGSGGVNYSNGSNDAKYGKLYTWAEAKAIAVPTGWRLPTKADFDKLFDGLGATTDNSGYKTLNHAGTLKLMSTSGWSMIQGNNQTGLNVYPAGVFTSTFFSKGEESFFWSNTPLAGSNGAFVWFMGVWQESNGSVESGTDHYGPENKLSVRFVKDN